MPRASSAWPRHHAHRRRCRRGGAGRVPDHCPQDRPFRRPSRPQHLIYRVTTNAALIKRRGKRAQLEVSLEEHLPTFKEDGHRDGERSYLWPTGRRIPKPSSWTAKRGRPLEGHRGPARDVPCRAGLARRRGAVQRGDGGDSRRVSRLHQITRASGADGAAGAAHAPLGGSPSLSPLTSAIGLRQELVQKKATEPGLHLLRHPHAFGLGCEVLGPAVRSQIGDARLTSFQMRFSRR